MRSRSAFEPIEGSEAKGKKDLGAPPSKTVVAGGYSKAAIRSAYLADLQARNVDEWNRIYDEWLERLESEDSE